uniref:WAP domain-containing protein n=1 Tax=Vombatus ursinus TaxID=29139 RepID=A0A4X2L3H3_VOMUR
PICKRGIIIALPSQVCCEDQIILLNSKPGRCPAVAEVCPEDRARIHTCRRDDHCNRGRKCCSSGCGRRCMDPVASPESQFPSL